MQCKELESFKWLAHVQTLGDGFLDQMRKLLHFTVTELPAYTLGPKDAERIQGIVREND